MNLPEGWPTDVMLQAAYREIERIEYISLGELHRAITAALAAAPTPPAQEEPVAYQAWHPNSPTWVSCSKLVAEGFAERKEGHIIRPLYLHPVDDKLRKAEPTDELPPLQVQVQELLPLLMNGIMPSREDLLYLRDLAYIRFEPTPSDIDKPYPG